MAEACSVCGDVRNVCLWVLEHPDETTASKLASRILDSVGDDLDAFMEEYGMEVPR